MNCSQGSQRQLLFPELLYVLLEDCERNADDEFHNIMIVSWSPHGNSFKVHDKDLFTETILPRYFRHSNYKSFARQLNVWGFQCITNGHDKGYCTSQSSSSSGSCYMVHRIKRSSNNYHALLLFVSESWVLSTDFHRHFLRGQRERLGMIKRVTQKAARSTSSLSSASEWDSWLATPSTPCLDVTVSTEVASTKTGHSSPRSDKELYTSIIVRAFDTDEIQPDTSSITVPTLAARNEFMKDEMIGKATDPALYNSKWSFVQPYMHGPPSETQGVEQEFLSSLPPPQDMADKSHSARFSINEPLEDWLTPLEKLLDAPPFNLTVNHYRQSNNSEELGASWMVLEPRPVQVMKEEQVATYRDVVDSIDEGGLAAAMPWDGEIWGMYPYGKQCRG